MHALLVQTEQEVIQRINKDVGVGPGVSEDFILSSTEALVQKAGKGCCEKSPSFSLSAAGSRGVVLFFIPLSWRGGGRSTPSSCFSATHCLWYHHQGRSRHDQLNLNFRRLLSLTCAAWRGRPRDTKRTTEQQFSSEPNFSWQ